MPPTILEQFAADFIASHRRSAERIGRGGTSTTLVALARIAASFARVAGRVEGWARGSAEAAAHSGRPAAAR